MNRPQSRTNNYVDQIFKLGAAAGQGALSLSSFQNGLFPDRQICDWEGNDSVSEHTESRGYWSIRVDGNWRLNFQ